MAHGQNGSAQAHRPIIRPAAQKVPQRLRLVQLIQRAFQQNLEMQVQSRRHHFCVLRPPHLAKRMAVAVQKQKPGAQIEERVQARVRPRVEPVAPPALALLPRRVARYACPRVQQRRVPVLPRAQPLPGTSYAGS